MSDIHQKIGDLTTVVSTYNGGHRWEPEILSCENKKFIAETNKVIEISLTDHLITNSKHVSINISKDINDTFLCPVISFFLPEIEATSPIDKVGYCSLPALNIFTTINLSIGLVTETFTPLTLELALRECLGDNFEYWANEYFGGINGNNQKIVNCSDFDQKSNKIIKSKIECIVPLPFHIFRNKEKISPELIKNSPTIITINSLKNLSNIISCNKNYNFDFSNKNSIEFNIELQCLDINSRVFNKLPQVNKNKLESAYLIVDQPYHEIDFAAKQEVVSNIHLKLPVRSEATTELFGIVYNKLYSPTNHFFGSTCEESHKNFWFSLLQNYDKDNFNSERALLMLNTMSFTQSRASLNQYRIHDIKSKKKIKLEYNIGNGMSNNTFITCNEDFEIFPENLVLDLDLFSSDGFIYPKPNYYSKVHFKVVPYDPNEHEIYSQMTNNMGVKLLNGYFVFESTKIDANGNKIKYALIDIEKIEKSKNVNNFLFDMSVSIPIKPKEKINTNLFVDSYFMKLSKPYFTYWDLDMKYKIKIDSLVLKYENQPSGYSFKHSSLQLNRHIQNKKSQKYPFHQYQIHFDYNFKVDNENSYGFYYYNKGSEIEITLDDLNLRHMDQNFKLSSQLTSYHATHLCLIHKLLKFIKLNPRFKFSYLNDEEKSKLAREIYGKELGETGVFYKYHEKLVENENLNNDKELARIKKRDVRENLKRKYENLSDNEEEEIEYCFRQKGEFKSKFPKLG